MQKSGLLRSMSHLVYAQRRHEVLETAQWRAAAGGRELEERPALLVLELRHHLHQYSPRLLVRRNTPQQSINCAQVPRVVACPAGLACSWKDGVRYVSHEVQNRTGLDWNAYNKDLTVRG